MTTKIPRLAASVLTALAAVAVLNVSTASAAEEWYSGGGDRLSTTCGAGTLDKCSTKPIESCDFDFQFSLGKESFTFKIGFTDCKVVGWVPIYKDVNDTSLLSESCSMLNVFLGMPAGSGCSV